MGNAVATVALPAPICNMHANHERIAACLAESGSVWLIKSPR